MNAMGNLSETFFYFQLFSEGKIASSQRLSCNLLFKA